MKISEILSEGKKATAAQLKAAVQAWLDSSEIFKGFNKPKVVLAGTFHRSVFKGVLPSKCAEVYKALKADGFKAQVGEAGVLVNKQQNIVVMFNVIENGQYERGATTADFKNKDYPSFEVTVQLNDNNAVTV
jgi:hypothetical protein